MSNELTLFDRDKLQYYLRTKKSLRDIAKIMHRDVSVLSREIERNGSGDRKKYRADRAQMLCEKRKHKQHKGKMDKYPELKKYVEEKIIDDWSPEQIAGRLKSNPLPELVGITISHESIYHHVYEKSEKHRKLYTHLRTYRKIRIRKGKRKNQKIAISSRISIHDRPEIIDKKDRFGDWESDTVEFQKNKKNPYLSVQYERKSQLVRMHKTLDKSAEETKQAIIKTAESVPVELFKTITFDNGSEGSKHLELKDYYPQIETYFCDPFSSWQKGGVENANKLIRQYLPRSIDMKNISDEEINQIQEKLNNRPRKGLNYQTPNEVIHKVLH